MLRNAIFATFPSQTTPKTDTKTDTHESARLLKFCSLRVRKVAKINEKCFLKKTDIFLGRWLVPIFRFPHSFWLWWYWELANIVNFVILESWEHLNQRISQSIPAGKTTICDPENSKTVDDIVGESPAPPQPKTMRETKY